MQKIKESTCNTIYSSNYKVTGLVDKDFLLASFESSRPTTPLTDTASKGTELYNSKEQEYQIIITKGQLGQFKFTCPQGWEMFSRSSHKTPITEAGRPNRHFVWSSTTATNNNSHDIYKERGNFLDLSKKELHVEGQKCLESAKRGVSQGYAVSLEVIGLGYSAELSMSLSHGQGKPTIFKQPPQLELLVREFEEPIKLSSTTTPQGKYMILNLGKSHKILHYVAANACDLVALRPNTNSMTILIFGISRSVVSQTAAEISRYKGPNAYSTKGISNPLRPSVKKSS